MVPDRKIRFNLFVGSVLVTLVTLPTLVIVFGEARQPSFLPNNAWLWPALLILLLSGLFVSLFGLMRKVHWGFFLWSQAILSFWVLIIYVGRYRADRDYLKFGSDPDAIYQGPPEASMAVLSLLTSVCLVVCFMPLALRYLWKRHKARKSRYKEESVN